MIKALCICILIFSSPKLWAEKIETYTGEAKKDGKTVYIENHTVTYSDAGKILKAETIYKTPDGKDLAKLNSDFSLSVTSPSHEVINYRTGNKQGLRRVDNDILLFNQEKDKNEETKKLEDKKTDNRILMGCQGLNYYLIDHMEEMKTKKTLPVRFLIPGILDYYDFHLNYINEEANGDVNFEVVIDSWILRIFASKLYVKYNKNTNHIVWYKGLSNITDENGDKQSVEINYVYP